MKVLRFVSLGIISLILILSLFGLFIGLTINKFSYPEIYLDSLEESGIYEEIDNKLEVSSEIDFIKIPENGSQEIVEEIVIESLEYVRGEDDYLQIKVDVDTKEFENFFIKQIENLPGCEENQNTLEEMICLPKDKDSSEFLKEFLEKENIDVLEKDNVNLVEVYELLEGENGLDFLDDMRYGFKMFKIILIVLSVLSLLLILSGFYLNSKMKNFMIWFGVIGVIFSLTQISMAGAIIALTMNLNAPMLFGKIIFVISKEIQKTFAIYGAISGGLGILFILFGIIIFSKKSKS